MPITIAVHSGTFHADDLFAVAALKKLLLSRGVREEDIEIIRTRDKEIFSRADFVADIGGVFDPETNRFDHHQMGGAGYRKNTIPYAAFGLVWKTYGIEITDSEEVARGVDERLVQTIDALDNGVEILGETPVNIPYRFLLQTAFANFMPTWKETEYSINDAFFEALTFAEKILDRVVAQESARVEAFAHIEETYKNSPLKDERILLLDQDYPYSRFVDSNEQIIFIVKPDMESGNWKVRAAQNTAKSFSSRKLLPEEWAGKTGAELASLTGVSDAVFVHNMRFIGVAETKGGAIELAKRALKN